jgi:hypothetical protein
MLHLGDNGCQKPPLLTPFLTPVVPRRARDRVPSILALDLFLAVSDFTQPKTAPLPSRPLSIYWLSPNRKLQSKMAPLRFCTSGSEMPLTEEPGLYQRAVPPLALTFCVHHEYVVWRSVLATFAVSVEDELSRLLPPVSPSFLTPSRCASSSFVAYYSRRPLRRPPTTGRRSCSTFPSHYSIRQIPPQDCWQDGDLERTPPTAHC